MLSEIAWFHLFTRLFLATKRVEEGCIHIWNSASEMLEVSVTFVFQNLTNSRHLKPTGTLDFSFENDAGMSTKLRGIPLQVLLLSTDDVFLFCSYAVKNVFRSPLCLLLFQNDFQVAYRLPWRLTEVPFLKFSFAQG